MEPQSYEPDDVENYIDRAAKRVDDESKAIARVVSHHDTCQLGKHHVVPEVEQMEQKTQANDDAQHQHVL